MENKSQYTVKELAKLAGVSVRTLHWYDEIGLLPPARISEAGYRLYETKQVNELQSILFYRELGVSCKDILTLQNSSSLDKAEVLQNHKKALLEKRNHLNTLLQTLNKTIKAQKGEITMTNEQKFEGFKQKQIAKNEEKYGAEIRKKYGESVVDETNAKMMNLTKEQYNDMQSLGAKISIALENAVKNGESSHGDTAKELVNMHKEWLMYSWNKYTPNAHIGLAQMYVADERFTAYYDENQSGCAQFLCEAITFFAK